MNTFSTNKISKKNLKCPAPPVSPPARPLLAPRPTPAQLSHNSHSTLTQLSPTPPQNHPKFAPAAPDKNPRDTQRHTTAPNGTQRQKQPPNTLINTTIKPPSPSYVQYMYSICTVFVRFGSVHILYIYCTYTVQRPENVPHSRCRNPASKSCLNRNYQ